MNKTKPTSKRPPNPFDFCPKHHVFYKSCGCDWNKKKSQEVESVVEPIKPGEEEK